MKLYEETSCIVILKEKHREYYIDWKYSTITIHLVRSV